MCIPVMRRGRREMENKEERNAPALFEGAEEIKGIEEAISDNDEIFVFQDPGPDTIHMHYHLYLIEVCRLISERGYEELDKVFKNKD